MVESPSASAGDTDSIPGLGWCHMAQSNQAHEPHLLSPYATPTEAWAPRACALQQRVAPSATGENSETAVKTQSSHTHINNYFLKIKMSSLPQWLKMLPLLFTKFQTYFFLSVDIHSCTSIILILSMEALKYVLIGDFMQIWFSIWTWGSTLPNSLKKFIVTDLGRTTIFVILNHPIQEQEMSFNKILETI